MVCFLQRQGAGFNGLRFTKTVAAPKFNFEPCSKPHTSKITGDDGKENGNDYLGFGVYSKEGSGLNG